MSNTQTLDNFIVTRDGLIDDNYYDELWQKRRKEVLYQAGSKLLEAIIYAPLTTIKLTINLLGIMQEQINNGNNTVL